MNFIQKQLQQDPFNRFIAVSFGAHICLLAFFTLKAIVLPSEPLHLKSAIRVDMVALPDKELPKPAASAPAAPKVEEVKKVAPAPPVKKEAPKVADKKVDISPKKAKPDTTKSNQQDALNRLKAMQAIDKLRQQQQETASDSKAAAKPQEFKGNVLSEGSSISGLAQIEFDRYLSEIETNIRHNWNLPKWLEDANLRAQVRVMLDERGYITRKVIETSSGNEAFDEAVMDTLEKSSPLPPPPQRLKNVLAARGFVLNFPE